MSRRQQNKAKVELAATLLGDMVEEVVFVGGTAPAFLITDSGAPDVRPTQDVDVIVEVTYHGYSNIEKRLIEMGFGPDLTVAEPLVCRWVSAALVLDVMPTDDKILGFSNYWYKQAFGSPLTFQLSESLTVKIINAPLFICTKIDAQTRRTEDRDVEDIVMVVDGRPSVIDEVKQSTPVVKEYIAKWCASMLSNSRFIDQLSWILPGDDASQARQEIILGRLGILTAIN
jgi:hypothetical protein